MKKNKLKTIFLILSILSGIGTIVSMVFYFIYKGKTSGLEFISLASKSLSEAYDLMKFTDRLGSITVILAIVTVVFIITTVIFFLVCKNSKKKINTGVPVK